MRRIEVDGYKVGAGITAYVFAKPHEVATIPLEDDESLVPLDIPIQRALLLYFLLPPDQEEFETFEVAENERLFAVAKIASLGIVG